MLFAKFYGGHSLGWRKRHPFAILEKMKSYEDYYIKKRNSLSDEKFRFRVVGALKKDLAIHISAVCGKAMASIACMLKEVGYVVTGSDLSFHPPMSDVLTFHDIKCLKPSIENLKNIGLFIPGNMLPSSDMEVAFAREKNISMMSGAEVLGELLTKNKRSLVVAGTHGKTTSSSLLVHLFLTADRNPAYLIGGVFRDSEKSYSMGDNKSSHVIFEGDEYDCAYFDKAPKFLRYNPTSAIITSIEHDHIDLYKTFEDYKQAFQFLVEDIPREGYMLIHQSTLSSLDISKCEGNVFVYGPSAKDIQYKIQETNSSGTIFSVKIKEKLYNDIFIPLFGEYNVSNATAVFALAFLEGLDLESIYIGLKTYPGTHERQEVLGIKNGNITIVRDFAHHPTAVGVTLEGLRLQYPNHRLICVFEPRSITSRRKIFEKEYPKVLSLADVSIVSTPPFRPGDNTENFMDISVVQKELQSMKKEIYLADNSENVLSILAENIKENDIIVFMSNGDFGNIANLFLKS